MSNTQWNPANKEWLHGKAEEMRICPTTCEARASDSMNAAGIEFYSQVVLGTYILDFVVPQKLLVVEIDGDSHDNQVLYDQFRDAFCTGVLGLKVLRIPNHLAHTAAQRIAQYPDVEDAVRKIELAFIWANGSLPNSTKKIKAAPKTSAEKEESRKRRSRIDAQKHKKHLAHEERRMANLAAKEAGLPTPRELRRRENRKFKKAKT